MAKVEKKVLKAPNARLSFLEIEKPKAFETGKTAKYQATALLDPSNAVHAAAIAEIKAEAVRLAKEKFGDSVEMKKLNLGFGSGDKKAIDSEGELNPTYEAYKGMFYVGAYSETKPLIADRLGKLIEPGHAQFPYSGSIGNMKFTLYTWTHPPTNRKGISVELRSIQFVKDGPAFGRGPIKAEDEFEGLGDEEGAAATVEDDAF